MAKVVGAHLEFKPVGGGASWRDHHAGVVDEKIKARVDCHDLGSSPFNAFEVCEVKFKQMDAAFRVSSENAFFRTICPLKAPASEDDFGSLSGKFHCHLKPNTGVGTRDQDNHIVLRGCIAQSPFLL
jgi:hypothetical protein